jgi:hypothetical protein
MLVKDAQKEVRTVFIGGFVGQLVSSTLWLVSAALGTWVSPRAAICELVCCGFFIFAITQLLLRISRRPASLRRENPLWFLGMQVAFVLPLSMLLLVPVCELRLGLFYPALMILLGAHYLPFTFMYGMRMFLLLAAILIGAGVVIGMYFPAPFSLGGWVGGVTLLFFAFLGRALVDPKFEAKT